MNLILHPLFGWVVSSLIALVLIGLAIFEIVSYIRDVRDVRGQERSRSDQAQDGKPESAQARFTDATVGSIIRRSLLCLLLAATVMTPSLRSQVTTRAVNATDVFIAVDTTGSMAVRDANYASPDTISRLEAASKAVKDIVRLYPDASFSAIHFDSTSNADLPLTPDSHAITQWADTLRTEPTAISQGSGLDTPLNTLITSMKSTLAAHPHDTIILYYISDGETTNGQVRSTFSVLRKYVTTGEVIGVGSRQGGKIPNTKLGLTVKDLASQNETNSWVKDPATKQDGLSSLNEANLKAIADEISGTYMHTGTTKKISLADIKQKSGRFRIQPVTRKYKHPIPLIWPLVIAFFLIFAWEAGAWIVTSRRLL
ncbi:MAG: hypothetical protein ACFNZJ_03350 [Parascardovia denticolens]